MINSLDRRTFLKWAGTAAMTVPMVACANPAEPSRIRQNKPLATGLYSWNEMTFMPERIRWLELTHARIGGEMSDNVMTFCAENNIEVLMNVSPAKPRTAFPTDAEFIDAYVAQVDKTLTAYGPGGSFWIANSALRDAPIMSIEICNEPNFGYGFSGEDSEVARLYAQLLIKSCQLIRSKWPKITVVAFAAGGASNAAPGFIAEALAALRNAGQLDCFDVAAVHIYSANQPPELPIKEAWGTWSSGDSMAKVQEIMSKFGVDKPLWITETGYQISHAEGGHFDVTTVVGDTSVGDTTVTPAQQAAYSIRMDMAAFRNGIPRVYHMSAMDTDHYNGGWFVTGDHYPPRPVATAMRQLIQLADGADRIEILADGNKDPQQLPYVYRLGTPRGNLVVAWSQNPTTIDIPIDAKSPTLVTDMLGNAITTVNGDTYTASLTETPIFLHAADQ